MIDRRFRFRTQQQVERTKKAVLQELTATSLPVPRCSSVAVGASLQSLSSSSSSAPLRSWLPAKKLVPATRPKGGAPAQSRMHMHAPMATKNLARKAGFDVFGMHVRRWVLEARRW